MVPFETLHTFCGHNEDVHMGFLMELELILPNYGLSNLVILGKVLQSRV